MNEFLSIVQNNLQNAQAASEKKKEIYGVLTDVSRAVQDATYGRVSIAKVDAINGFTDGLLKSLSLFMKNSTKTTVLVLRHVTYPSIQEVQIAFWEESALGYPCLIGFAGMTHRCTSKAALTTVLKQLLADPQIGMAIERLRVAKPSTAAPQSAAISADKGKDRANVIKTVAVEVKNKAIKGNATIKKPAGAKSRNGDAEEGGIKKAVILKPAGSGAKPIAKQAPKTRGTKI